MRTRHLQPLHHRSIQTMFTRPDMRTDTMVCWTAAVVSFNPILIEFFTVYTKLAEVALLASMVLTRAKKVTSSDARPA